MFSIGRTPGSSRVYQTVSSPPCESPFAAIAAMSDIQRWGLVGTRAEDIQQSLKRLQILHFQIQRSIHLLALMTAL